MIDDRFKPCPFCGKGVHLISCYHRKGDTYDVSCYTDDCYLEFGADWQLETVEELLKMWNRRITNET